jgi:hypothetical protein
MAGLLKRVSSYIYNVVKDINMVKRLSYAVTTPKAVEYIYMAVAEE